MNIEELKDIVREAANLMVTDGFRITEKDGCSNIVTSSDLAVQHFLCQRLQQALPDSGFLCEEEDVNEPASHEWTWVIDPIDGTANYSRGIDQCAICVGLRHKETMQMGVVYLPRTQEMFWAEREKGAYLNDRRIHVSKRSFADSVLCTALPVYHKEYAAPCAEIIKEAFMQCNDIRRFGACAPELCYLAMGRCELYFEYLLSPWDFAAASLILTEAGGVITDLNGHALGCDRPSGVLAANHPESLERLRQIVQKHTQNI